METSSHTTAELDRILDGVDSSAETDGTVKGQSTPRVSVTRAVIVTGERDSFDPELFPSALAPIVDKPFLQHVVESLIRQGITEFDVVLESDSEKVEALLGNGSRWGTSIRFHLTGQAASACQIIRGMFSDEDSPIVYVSGERFYPGSTALLTADGSRFPAAYVIKNENSEPAGMAVLPGSELAGLAFTKTSAELDDSLLAVCHSRGRTIEVEASLDVTTGERLLETQRRVLAGDFPELIRHFGKADNRVWIGRNTTVPASAKVTGPVFFGERVDIGEGAEIGPNVVISSGCVIDQGTIVESSLILPRTSIGEQLELRDSIVGGRRLFNARLGAALDVPNDFLVGDLDRNIVLPSAGRTFSRCAASVLLVAFSPIIALTWCLMRLSGPAVTRRDVARLASQRRHGDPGTLSLISFRGRTGKHNAAMSRRAVWRHFLCELLPGLVHIARGELAFTGVTPASQAEISSMSEEWRQLYLASKAGLINEAFVRCGTSEPGFEREIADAHYAVQTGRRHRLDLALMYLRRLFL
jgi:hypothetical protein